MTTRKIAQVRNIETLRNDLYDVFTEVRSKKLDVKIARELSNISGKIISSVNVELKAAEINKTKADIGFLKKSIPGSRNA